MIGMGARREIIVRRAKKDSEYKVREVKGPQKLFTWSMRLSSLETWDPYKQVL